ncbi:MAG: hypothetical protein N4A43_03440 [Alphaproteobacteria bacterium]|jgi:hypothetical protein|nr:hypothetical protein [Alphaproteobacteria bacterium]
MKENYKNYYMNYCSHSWEEKILRVKNDYKATLYCCYMCGAKRFKTEVATHQDFKKKNELELYHKIFGSAMKKHSPKKLKSKKKETSLNMNI